VALTLTGSNSSVPIVASFANIAVSTVHGHPLWGNCSTNCSTDPNWAQTFVTWREKSRREATVRRIGILVVDTVLTLWC
jgi:hypothetical protein